MIEATYVLDTPCPARLGTALRFCGTDHLLGTEVVVEALHTYPERVVEGDVLAEVRCALDGQSYGAAFFIPLTDLAAA
jgi:hypothetical protein